MWNSFRVVTMRPECPVYEALQHKPVTHKLEVRMEIPDQIWQGA
jgi:hypothetical protein